MESRENRIDPPLICNRPHSGSSLLPIQRRPAPPGRPHPSPAGRKCPLRRNGAISERSAAERSSPSCDETSVLRAAFFGSIVRGEMNEESDGEILVEFAGR